MFKSILITALFLITISLTAQEQEVKRPLQDSIWLTDQIFMGAIVPRVNNAIKLIQDSSIPIKDGNKTIGELSDLLNYLNNQMLEKHKAEKVESDKPKSKAKSK